MQESEDLDRHPVADPVQLGESVPVLDIGPLRAEACDPAFAAVAHEIAEASRGWGFFQVTNHGISAELIDSALRRTRNFFSLPQSQKDAVVRNRENPWGYYNNELTKNQRDKKEVFDYTVEGIDPIYGSSNRWPETATGFRQVMLAYLDACATLSLELLQAFCVGLGVPPDYLHREFVGRHTGFVRLNHYPVDDPMRSSSVDHLAQADLGIHHHTDAGALTVLLQDSVSGLQVHRDGKWHDVRPIDDALVVNTGDMMQVWSNDLYKAPVHRVLAMEVEGRCSIPFFFNPAATTQVSPLPALVGDSNPARYRSIGWSEFRGRRTDGDYADYGTEVQISQFRTGP